MITTKSTMNILRNSVNDFELVKYEIPNLFIVKGKICIVLQNTLSLVYPTCFF